MLPCIAGLCDAVQCTESKIKCAMGDGDCCLSKDRVCDGYTDCMDQRDEGAICPGQSTYNLINTTHNLLNITPWYSDGVYIPIYSLSDTGCYLIHLKNDGFMN